MNKYEKTLDELECHFDCGNDSVTQVIEDAVNIQDPTKMFFRMGVVNVDKLCIGYSPDMKEYCLYLNKGNTVKVIAYFVSKEAVLEFVNNAVFALVRNEEDDG